MIIQCRHCKRMMRVRQRGLCWKCYYSPPIRYMYSPVECIYMVRGSGLENTTSKTPSSPTREYPATESKISVMADRIARGESAFHPHDAQRNTE